MNDGVILDFTGVKGYGQPQDEQDRAKKTRRIGPLFNFASGLVLRGAVSSVVKLGAASVVIGFGGTALASFAAGVAAAAAVSATWTYFSERKKSHEEYEARVAQGENVTYANVLRKNRKSCFSKVALGLGCGVAFGALGAWLAQGDVLSTVFEKAQGLFSGADVVTAAAPVAESVTAAASDSVAAVAPADGVLPPAIDSPAVDPLAAGLGYANIDSADGVSAQTLKDAAHNVLRMEDVAAADRVDMARALAEEAAARGNDQASAFLSDLPKVEVALGLEPQAVADAAPLSAAPVFDTPVPSPADAADLAPVVEAPAPEPVVSAPAAPAASLAQTFSAEAAACTVSVDDTASITVSCVTHSDVMNPGDHITLSVSTGETEIITLGTDTPQAVVTSDFVDVATPDAVASLVSKAAAGAKMGAAL